MNIFTVFADRFTNVLNFGFQKQPKSVYTSNDNIQIDKTRFESIMQKRGVPSHVIDTLFKTIDVDGDGKINKNDFQRVLQKYTQSTATPRTEPQRSNDIKRDETPISNIPKTPHKRNTVNHQTPAPPLNDLIASLKKQAPTYNKNGASHVSMMSAFVNTRV